jgi:hypothetical protein
VELTEIPTLFRDRRTKVLKPLEKRSVLPNKKTGIGGGFRGRLYSLGPASDITARVLCASGSPCPRRGSPWCNYRHVPVSRDTVSPSRAAVSPFYSSSANLARQSLVEHNNSLIRISEASVCVPRHGVCEGIIARR